MLSFTSLIASTNNKKHYRSREEIYALILEAARDVPFCSYTDMAYASRMTYSYSVQFINELVDTYLIAVNKGTRHNYHITTKGTRFLALWYEMRKSLSLPDNLD